ncbi:hypothetical protein QUB63_09210 [Microcoleus sp. ARI1-B5]
MSIGVGAATTLTQAVTGDRATNPVSLRNALILELETGFLPRFHAAQPDFSEKPGFFEKLANT